jgi:hypothetical protein
MTIVDVPFGSIVCHGRVNGPTCFPRRTALEGPKLAANGLVIVPSPVAALSVWPSGRWSSA